MRFEKKQIAATLAAVGSGTAFDCSTWVEKTIQAIGAGTVDIEGTIDGTTWKKIGATVTSPALVAIVETVWKIRPTWVSGSVDVWIAGLNSQTE